MAKIGQLSVEVLSTSGTNSRVLPMLGRLWKTHGDNWLTSARNGGVLPESPPGTTVRQRSGILGVHCGPRRFRPMFPSRTRRGRLFGSVRGTWSSLPYQDSPGALPSQPNLGRRLGPKVGRADREMVKPIPICQFRLHLARRMANTPKYCTALVPELELSNLACCFETPAAIMMGEIRDRGPTCRPLAAHVPAPGLPELGHTWAISAEFGSMLPKLGPAVPGHVFTPPPLGDAPSPLVLSS